MSDLLSAFTSLFTFLVNSLSTIASFFTTNLIGQIILGLAVFSVVVSIVSSFVDKMK